MNPTNINSNSKRPGKVLSGSITIILTKHGGGFLRTENGDELYFDQSMLDGVSFKNLKPGDWMEFELFDSGPSRPTQVIRRLWFVGARHSSAVQHTA